MRFEAAAEETAGGQDHRLRVHPDRAEGVAEGEGRAVALEAQRGDPLLGNQGHAFLRQHLLHQLAQADARHRRRHGGNFEDFAAGESFQFRPHLVRPVHAEDRRQADEPGRSGNGAQCRGELFPGRGNFQRPRHDFGIDLAAFHAGKNDALRRQLRPALAQIGRQLGAAESLQALEVDDHAGGVGGQGARSGGHGGRHAERLFQGAGRGQRREVAGPRRAVGQPAGTQKIGEFGEGLPDVAGVEPTQRMLRLRFAQAGQGLPRIDDHRAPALADQIQVARGIGQRPGVADLRRGDLAVYGEDRRGKTGNPRADHGQLGAELPRCAAAAHHSSSSVSRPSSPQCRASASSICAACGPQITLRWPLKRSSRKSRKWARPVASR